MKQTNITALRKTVFNKNTLTTAGTIGSTAFKRLYRKLDNMRVPPYAVAAIIAYLESRRNCGDLVGCKPLHPDVADKLSTEFYLKIFTTSLVTGKKDFVGGFENGALFHMVVTAYYHLQYEAGTDSAQPIDIEKNFQIPLYTSLSSNTPYQDKPFSRRIDILLKGDEPGKETWVETKSYKSPFDKKRYTLWNFTKGKQSTADLEDGESRAIHRQFFLDRVATQTKVPARKMGGDMQWWFHSFKRKTIAGYTVNDLEKARSDLTDLPSANPEVVRISLGGSRAFNNNKINRFTVKTAVLTAFRNKLFNELTNSDFSNLIENSNHDLL